MGHYFCQRNNFTKSKLIKIPSACNNNYPMLEWLCDNYSGEIHISTGMTTKSEVDEVFKLFFEKGKK